MKVDAVYRILDANCNRLREAIRVIEEYYRFIENNESLACELKLLRHEIAEIETGLGTKHLLENRDSVNDCFADTVREEEMQRNGETAVVTANFKRAQEAARVIEEYAKIVDGTTAAEKAKKARFTLYRMEQRFGNR